MHVLFSRGVSHNQVSFSEHRFTHTRVDPSNVCLLPCRRQSGKTLTMSDFSTFELVGTGEL